MKPALLIPLFLATVLNMSHGENAASLKNVNLRLSYGHDSMQTLRKPHISSLDEIPEKLKRAAESHIKDRIGDNNTSLTFAGLWRIDDERILKEAYPESESLDERIVYHLEYSVDVSEIGLKEFSVYLRMRDDFTVFKDLRLPRQGKNWKLVHLENIFHRGVSMVRKGKSYGVDLRYDRRTDKMIWIVKSYSSNTGFIEMHEAEFDSTNGEFLGFNESWADGF